MHTMRTAVASLGCVIAVGAFGEPVRHPVWPEGKIPAQQASQKYEPYYHWFDPTNRQTDAIMICCSGGAYHGSVTGGFETQPVIDFLLEKGMTVVEFCYRGPRPAGLPKYMLAWQDEQRVVRIVRHEARRRGLDPERIGFTGCSAGGHLSILAAVSSTTNAYSPIGDEIDREPCHVNFAIPVYPAYGMSDVPDGCAPSNDLSIPLAGEFLFDRQTPPMCFLHGESDAFTPMTSVRCWHKLRTMGIPADLHALSLEVHAFQLLVRKDMASDRWKDTMWSWLTRMDFVTRHPYKWRKTWQGREWTYPELKNGLASYNGRDVWHHLCKTPDAAKSSEHVVGVELPEKCLVDFDIEVYGDGARIAFGAQALKLPASKYLRRVTVKVDGNTLTGFVDSKPISRQMICASPKDLGRHLGFFGHYCAYQDLRFVSLD